MELRRIKAMKENNAKLAALGLEDLASVTAAKRKREEEAKAKRGASKHAKIVSNWTSLCRVGTRVKVPAETFQNVVPRLIFPERGARHPATHATHSTQHTTSRGDEESGGRRVLLCKTGGGAGGGPQLRPVRGSRGDRAGGGLANHRSLSSGSRTVSEPRPSMGEDGRPSPLLTTVLGGYPGGLRTLPPEPPREGALPIFDWSHTPINTPLPAQPPAHHTDHAWPI